MSSPRHRMLKRSAQTAHDLVSQVIVSVAAAICVAFITNAYFDKQAAPPPPPQREAAQTRANDREPSAARLPEMSPPSGATRPAEQAPQARAALPKLDQVIIADVPAPAMARAQAPVSYGTEIFPAAVSGEPWAADMAPAPVEQPRPRLFGLPLPRFLPTPGGIARSIGAAKDRVAALAPGHDRRGERAGSDR